MDEELRRLHKKGLVVTLSGAAPSYFSLTVVEQEELRRRSLLEGLDDEYYVSCTGMWSKKIWI